MEETTVVTEKQEGLFAEPSKAEAPKPGPADELRQIQALLVNGIFPGNIAPQVVKAFQLLEAMAQKVEADAKKSA